MKQRRNNKLSQRNNINPSRNNSQRTNHTRSQSTQSSSKYLLCVNIDSLQPSVNLLLNNLDAIALVQGQLGWRGGNIREKSLRTLPNRERTYSTEQTSFLDEPDVRRLDLLHLQDLDITLRVITSLEHNTTQQGKYLADVGTTLSPASLAWLQHFNDLVLIEADFTIALSLIISQHTAKNLQVRRKPFLIRLFWLGWEEPFPSQTWYGCPTWSHTPWEY